MEDHQKAEEEKSDKLKEELRKKADEYEKLKESLAKEQHEKNKRQNEIDVSFELVIYPLFLRLFYIFFYLRIIDYSCTIRID